MLANHWEEGRGHMLPTTDWDLKKSKKPRLAERQTKKPEPKEGEQKKFLACSNEEKIKTMRGGKR